MREEQSIAFLRCCADWSLLVVRSPSNILSITLFSIGTLCEKPPIFCVTILYPSPPESELRSSFSFIQLSNLFFLMARRRSSLIFTYRETISSMLDLLRFGCCSALLISRHLFLRYVMYVFHQYRAFFHCLLPLFGKESSQTQGGVN